MKLSSYRTCTLYFCGYCGEGEHLTYESRVNQLHGARMALTSTSSCLHIPRPITLEVPDMIAFATRITLKREGDAKLS